MIADLSASSSLAVAAIMDGGCDVRPWPLGRHLGTFGGRPVRVHLAHLLLSSRLARLLSPARDGLLLMLIDT